MQGLVFSITKTAIMKIFWQHSGLFTWWPWPPNQFSLFLTWPWHPFSLAFNLSYKILNFRRPSLLPQITKAGHTGEAPERRERGGFSKKKSEKETQKPMWSIGFSFAPNAISPVIYSDNRGGSRVARLAWGALDDTMRHQPAQPLKQWYVR